MDLIQWVQSIFGHFKYIDIVPNTLSNSCFHVSSSTIYFYLLILTATTTTQSWIVHWPAWREREWINHAFGLSLGHARFLCVTLLEKPLLYTSYLTFVFFMYIQTFYIHYISLLDSNLYICLFGKYHSSDKVHQPLFHKSLANMCLNLWAGNLIVLSCHIHQVQVQGHFCK